jgi:uncharacterized membrane protein
MSWSSNGLHECSNSRNSIIFSVPQRNSAFAQDSRVMPHLSSSQEEDVADKWETWLARWTDAGVVDAETAARVRAYEAAHGDSALRWPIKLALVFGALALGAGVLLFVGAHWDDLSPASRFGLVTALVATFHVGGALIEERFPAMAQTLHAIGTVALGAGIYLAGQIFNLDEHWPGGLMLWALGAALAWALLKSWPQAALTAILVPAWLTGEWIVASEPYGWVSRYDVMSAGLLLLALTYFTSESHKGNIRRTLVWIGGVALVPVACALGFSSVDVLIRPQTLPSGLLVMGWTVAIGVPLLFAIVLRRMAAWPNALAAVWVIVAVNLRPTVGETWLYAWWAVGATALAAWGVADKRSERVNMATAIFAGTVIAFYFSHVMDKIGRSASLIGLGLLFLAGGFGIEQVRRRLVSQARGGRA